MDSTTVAAFSPHQTGSAAQPARPLEPAVASSFSHQQQPQPAEQNHGSFSHVSVIPLHIMGTTTPFIVAVTTPIFLHSFSRYIENFQVIFFL